MSRKIRSISLTLVILLGLILAAPAPAVANDDIYRDGTALSQMGHKAGRGVVNFFTGWIEIPKCMVKRWKQYDPFTGIIVGGIEGFFWGCGRTATGIYDFFTFPIPIPQDYAPLMEPEFILPSIWGEPLPFMEPVSGLKPLAP